MKVKKNGLLQWLTLIGWTLSEPATTAVPATASRLQFPMWFLKLISPPVQQKSEHRFNTWDMQVARCALVAADSRGFNPWVVVLVPFFVSFIFVYKLSNTFLQLKKMIKSNVQVFAFWNIFTFIDVPDGGIIRYLYLTREQGLMEQRNQNPQCITSSIQMSHSLLPLTSACCAGHSTRRFWTRTGTSQTQISLSTTWSIALLPVFSTDNC